MAIVALVSDAAQGPLTFKWLIWLSLHVTCFKSITDDIIIIMVPNAEYE